MDQFNKNISRITAGMLIIGLAFTAFAQSTQALSEGKNFGKSISPTSKGQVVNPSAVNTDAWSGNTSMSSTVPSGLGGFSTPMTGSEAFSNAKTMGLSGLGNSAMNKCENYVPTGDPAKDQECAAVNFLATRCLTPNTNQKKILGSQGVSQAQAANCDGTFGAGQENFDFSNQITAKDSIFDSITKATANPNQTVGNACSTQTVVTEPAATETSECTKAQATNEEACSQYVNLAVTTTQTAAISTNYCPEGTLVGAFCQSSTTGAASPVYTCAAGQTLVGTTCSQTTTATATPSYSCPTGSTLSGSNCISVNNVSTPATVASYSCSAGFTLSGSTCTKTTTTTATVASYSCPAGQTLQGSSCVATSTSTTSASQTITCPAGTTQSGNNCVLTSNYVASTNYYCPAGVLSGNTCTNTTYSSAIPQYSCHPGAYYYNGSCIPTCCASSRCFQSPYTTYSCPAGSTLSGTSCITNSTTSASIGSYSCPSGGTLSGSTCTTTTSTSATVSYSCPAGQTLSGSNCTQTVTTTSAATPSYSCPSGSTLSGTTCTQNTSAAATPSYSCPTGSTLNGSNCVTANNVTTPATVASYSCSAGYTLSGSTCTKTNSTNAAISYSCPSGSTLSGSNCITVVTTPAKINYSCLDGSAPVNGACIYKSAKTEWINTCGALETASGNYLTTP